MSGPGIGLSTTLTPVPARLVGPDGWVDPDALARTVGDALARTVGGLLPPGAGSRGPVLWTDRAPGGGAMHRAEGLHATRFVATPADVLDCLRREGARDVAAHAERSVEVRYGATWGDDRAPPGTVRLLFSVRVRPAGRGPTRPVFVPRHVACLVADLQRSIEGG